MERVAIGHHCIDGLQGGELVATIEAKGICVASVVVAEVGVRVEDRKNSSAREALDADQVLGETRMIDGVGEGKRVPGAVRGLELHGAIPYSIALQHVTTSYSHKNTAFRVHTCQ